MNKMPRNITLSTGEVPFSYEIIDIVFAYSNSSENFFQGANPIQAYEEVSNVLEQTAAQMGADAVIWIKYDYRVALNQGPLGPNQVFEVFAYGTAVKLA